MVKFTADSKVMGRNENMSMEKRKELFSKIAVFSFYLAIVTEVLIVIVDKSAWINPIEGRLFQLTFVLCFIKVCLTRYSRKEYLVLALFLGLGAVSYLVTGRNEILRVVMFIGACKDVDMERCLKLVFYLTLAGCLAIIGLSLLGIGGGAVLTQDYGRGSIESRYALGMGHPNALQCMIWALTALGLYLYREKMKWYLYIAVFLVNTGFFLLTGSKTAMLVTVYTVLGFALITFIRRKALITVFSFGNILLCAISILVSVIAAKDAMCMYVYYTQGIWTKKAAFLSKLDGFLTGRIASLFGTTNFEGTMQTWSLFSRPENNYFFDMGWVRLFYWYGIIPAGVAVLVMFVFLLYFVKQHKPAEIVLITAFAIYTIVEAHAVSEYMARNYVLFVIAMYWWQIGKSSKNGSAVVQCISAKRKTSGTK